MKSRFSHSLMAAGLIGLVAFGAGRTAEAALRLRIQAGGQDTGVVTEEQVASNGGTLNVTGGHVTLDFDVDTGTSLRYVGTLDSVNFNLGVTGSTNEPGETYFGFVNLNGAFTSTTNNNRAVTIASWASSFQVPVTPPAITQALSVSGTLTRGNLSSGQGTGLVDNSATVQSSLINAGPNQSIGTPVVTNSIATLLPGYEFRTTFNAVLTNRAQVTGFAVNHTLTKPVPEPSTLAVAGIGVLLGLGAVRHRKRTHA